MYVLATFPDRASAEHAMHDLEGAGFARSGMTLTLSAQPAVVQGGALLTVDAGDRSDDARMLLRQNNAINLQDAGEVVPLVTHTPLSAMPAGPANPAAPNQAAPAMELPSDANTAPQVAGTTGVGTTGRPGAMEGLGDANIVPPAMPIVMPPLSPLGGMNIAGIDLTQPVPLPTDAATAPAQTPEEPRIPGLDPAASTDALAGGGGLLPPVDDPLASENTNPEMHPTTHPRI